MPIEIEVNIDSGSYIFAVSILFVSVILLSKLIDVLIDGESNDDEKELHDRNEQSVITVLVKKKILENYLSFRNYFDMSDMS